MESIMSILVKTHSKRFHIAIGTEKSHLYHCYLTGPILFITDPNKILLNRLLFMKHWEPLIMNRKNHKTLTLTSKINGFDTPPIHIKSKNKDAIIRFSRKIESHITNYNDFKLRDAIFKVRILQNGSFIKSKMVIGNNFLKIIAGNKVIAKGSRYPDTYAITDFNNFQKILIFNESQLIASLLMEDLAKAEKILIALNSNPDMLITIPSVIIDDTFVPQIKAGFMDSVNLFDTTSSTSSLLSGDSSNSDNSSSNSDSLSIKDNSDAAVGKTKQQRSDYESDEKSSENEMGNNGKHFHKENEENASNQINEKRSPNKSRKHQKNEKKKKENKKTSGNGTDTANMSHSLYEKFMENRLKTVNKRPKLEKNPQQQVLLKVIFDKIQSEKNSHIKSIAPHLSNKILSENNGLIQKENKNFDEKRPKYFDAFFVSTPKVEYPEPLNLLYTFNFENNAYLITLNEKLKNKNFTVDKPQYSSIQFIHKVIESTPLNQYHLLAAGIFLQGRAVSIEVMSITICKNDFKVNELNNLLSNNRFKNEKQCAEMFQKLYTNGFVGIFFDVLMELVHIRLTIYHSDAMMRTDELIFEIKSVFDIRYKNEILEKYQEIPLSGFRVPELRILNSLNEFSTYQTSLWIIENDESNENVASRKLSPLSKVIASLIIMLNDNDKLKIEAGNFSALMELGTKISKQCEGNNEFNDLYRISLINGDNSEEKLISFILVLIFNKKLPAFMMDAMNMINSSQKNKQSFINSYFSILELENILITSSININKNFVKKITKDTLSIITSQGRTLNIINPTVLSSIQTNIDNDLENTRKNFLQLIEKINNKNVNY